MCEAAIDTSLDTSAGKPECLRPDFEGRGIEGATGGWGSRDGFGGGGGTSQAETGGQRGGVVQNREFDERVLGGKVATGH